MAPGFMHVIKFDCFARVPLNVLGFHLILKTDLVKKGSLFLPYLAFWAIRGLHNLGGGVTTGNCEGVHVVQCYVELQGCQISRKKFYVGQILEWPLK